MAAEVVQRLQSEEIFDVLCSLVDKSLVVMEETPTGLRYRFLETVREYLLETHGRSAEAATCRLKHRKYFLDLSRLLQEKLESAEGAPLAAAMERDHDNIRAAIECGIREEPLDALMISSALRRFWLIRGHLREGSNRVRRALDETENEGQNLERAQALLCMGTLNLHLGEHEISEKATRESMRIFENVGDLTGIGGCLGVLGSITTHRSDYALAREIFERYLAIGRETNNPGRIATALNNLGIVCSILGDFEGALKFQQEALEERRSTGQTARIYLSLSNLGEVYSNLGDYAKARELLLEAKAMAEEAGDRYSVVCSLNALGVLSASLENWEEARELLERSAREADAVGELAVGSECRLHLCAVLFEIGDIDGAIARLREALSGYQKLAGKMGIASALVAGGLLFRDPRLWAVADRLRAEAGVRLAGNALHSFERFKDRLVSELGAEKFEEALRAGEAMTMSDAIAIMAASHPLAKAAK